MESRDAIFDENRYSSIPGQNDVTPSTTIEEVDWSLNDQELAEQTLDENVASTSSYS